MLIVETESLVTGAKLQRRLKAIVSSSGLKSALLSSELKAVLWVLVLLAVILGFAYIPLYGTQGASQSLLDFVSGVHIEAVGFLFDIALFGVVLFVVRIYDEDRRKKQETIDRNLEIIDDYRPWDSPEAHFRIFGALRRLGRYTTSFDLAGLRMSSVSFRDNRVTNISRSSFYAPGERTVLRQVSFRDVVCNSVTFSDGRYEDDAKSAEVLFGLMKFGTYRTDVLKRFELDKMSLPMDLLDRLRVLLEGDSTSGATLRASGAIDETVSDGEVAEMYHFAVKLFARLTMQVAFEAVGVDFGRHCVNAQFDGARIVFPESGFYGGDHIRRSKFRRATVINASVPLIDPARGNNFDKAWVYMTEPVAEPSGSAESDSDKVRFPPAAVDIRKRLRI